MPAPASILPVLDLFRPEFSPRTWPRVVTLILGTILARGRRTVTAALRQMGLHDAPGFSSYHQVFNRAAWSPRGVARRLLPAAIAAFVPEGVGLTFAIDETLERRWGRKIRIRGHYRDPLASSKDKSVAASGIRWIVLALVITPPWSTRPWALPILSLPCPTPKVSVKLGRRHRTIAVRARQMIARLRRWLPRADLTVVGDTAYSVIELGLACRRHRVRLIAPLRLDARLFTPAPPRAPRTVGRPRVAGDRLPSLDVVLADPKTSWATIAVRWYDGSEKALEVATGTAVWYHNGMEPLPIRWVLTRDPARRLEPRAYFSTRLEDDPATTVAEFVKRWPIEVTFEEARAHLGVETQRQWSDRAIERETPCLLGLYSVVALLGHALHRASPIAIRAAAWYPKAEATFSDVLAAARRECWGFLDIRTSAGDPSYAEIPRAQLDRLLNAVCYAH
jgi:DDE superfamily endonuclease